MPRLLASRPPVAGPDRQPPATGKLILALVIATVVVSGLVRFVSLAALDFPVFDEHYYAHDAAALLHGHIGPRGAEPWRPGDALSVAHPPAAELAIAAGIAVFGDGPWGWRVPSAIAGTLLIALIYPLGRRLRLSPPWALAATVLAAADTMLIAQSRLAMLDIYVALWSAVCIYCALRAAADERRPRLWLVFCGLSGGLAVASKWSGVLAIVAAAVVLAAARRRRQPPPRRRQALFAAACLTLLPAAVYIASYAAYFAQGHTLGQWWRLQRFMVHWDLALRGSSPYASRPATWPFDLHAIWYAWNETRDGVVAMLGLGNPFLWWTAVVCSIALGVRAVGRRDLALGLPVLLVGLLYLPWLAATRQTYIYYMTPVVPFSALLVAAALARLAGDAPAPRGRVAVAFVAGLVPAALAAWLTVVASAVWHALAGVSTALAATVLALAVAAAAGGLALLLQRRPAGRPLVAWLLVGAIAGLGIAYLPFLLGRPFPYEYYRHLMWLVAWR